jgi:hypothetical protein
MGKYRKLRGRRRIRSSAGKDAELLVLGRQLNAAVRELMELEADPSQTVDRIEAHLAKMEPVESAILAIPARGMAGLEVKARVAAHVVSNYWDVPLDRLDFDARVVRLVIDAVFGAAGVPHPLEPDLDPARLPSRRVADGTTSTPAK